MALNAVLKVIEGRKLIADGIIQGGGDKQKVAAEILKFGTIKKNKQGDFALDDDNEVIVDFDMKKVDKYIDGLIEERAKESPMAADPVMDGVIKTLEGKLLALTNKLATLEKKGGAAKTGGTK